MNPPFPLPLEVHILLNPIRLQISFCTHITILRVPRRCRDPHFLLYGSGVWDNKEQSRSGIDGSDKAGASEEVDRAGGYGGSVEYLRTHHRRHHQYRYQLQG
ncbi:hypothetical protein PS2_001405 [Malus domestica]